MGLIHLIDGFYWLIKVLVISGERKNMCKKSSNIISVMIIISILLSIVSCNKSNPNEKETREILPESPWYYGEIIDIDLGIDNNRTVESLRQSYAGSDDNNIYILLMGDIKLIGTKFNLIQILLLRIFQ